ncbi:MAG TPA: polysaccharide biosynthesis/export family protein [Allosphingosinicella sp.]|nr:polysaccharide biosynthesis/export family protein [Allosphingosinicella sp.]
MGRRLALALLGLALALAGCAQTRRSDIAYAPPSFNVPPDDMFAVARDHRLGPMDLVSVAVYRAPEVTGDFRVDQLGNLTIPLIGQMPVMGLTTTELSNELKRRLSATLYVNPDVSVALKETPGQTITVDGSVGAPGAYPITGRTTLMQAVALARGASANANLRRVIVFRQVGGQRMAAGFDLRAIRASQMEDPVVYPSDIIIVDGNDTRQTWRDVLSAIPILALFRPFIL